MTERTFAIGDIHGEIQHLAGLLSLFPDLGERDTLVFLGDYLDRGPHSRELIEYLIALPSLTRAKVVCLRGNHEDAWLRVCSQGWDEFLLPARNGCLATYRSFTGGSMPTEFEMPRQHEMLEMSTGILLSQKHSALAGAIFPIGTKTSTQSMCMPGYRAKKSASCIPRRSRIR